MLYAMQSNCYVTHLTRELKISIYILGELVDAYVVSCRKLLAMRSCCRRILWNWNSQARNVELFQMDAVSESDDKVLVLYNL
jgi:hypothetical protein